MKTYGTQKKWTAALLCLLMVLSLAPMGMATTDLIQPVEMVDLTEPVVELVKPEVKQDPVVEPEKEKGKDLIKPADPAVTEVDLENITDEIVPDADLTIALSTSSSAITLGSSVTLTASVMVKPGAKAPAGNIEFKAGGRTLATRPIEDGKASCRWTPKSQGSLGTFVLTATYVPAEGETLKAGVGKKGLTVVAPFFDIKTSEAEDEEDIVEAVEEEKETGNVGIQPLIGVTPEQAAGQSGGNASLGFGRPTTTFMDMAFSGLPQTTTAGEEVRIAVIVSGNMNTGTASDPVWVPARGNVEVSVNGSPLTTIAWPGEYADYVTTWTPQETGEYTITAKYVNADGEDFAEGDRVTTSVAKTVLVEAGDALVLTPFALDDPENAGATEVEITLVSTTPTTVAFGATFDAVIKVATNPVTTTPVGRVTVTAWAGGALPSSGLTVELDASGTATIEGLTATREAGSYDLTVNYTATDGVHKSLLGAKVSIPTEAKEITIEGSISGVANNYAVNIIYDGLITGTPLDGSFTIAKTKGTAASPVTVPVAELIDGGGIADLNWAELVATDEVTISYTGTGYYEADDYKITVTYVPTIELTATPATPAVYGSEVTLTAEIDDGTNPKNNITVTFYDGDTSLGTAATDADGKATFKLTPTAGDHTFRASFMSKVSEDVPVVASIPYTVNKLTPTLAVNFNEGKTEAEYGTRPPLVLSVGYTAGNTEPTGDLNWWNTANSEFALVYKYVTGDKGIKAFTYPIMEKPGSAKIEKFQYVPEVGSESEKNYNEAESATTTYTITKAKTEIKLGVLTSTQTGYTLPITITAPGVAVDAWKNQATKWAAINGTIKLFDSITNAEVTGITTNAYTQSTTAASATTSITIPATSVTQGRSYYAVYQGNEYYDTSRSGTNVTIPAVTSTTTLTVTPIGPDVFYGQKLELKAAVTRTNTTVAAAQVDFYNGTTLIGTASVGTDGYYTYSYLPAVGDAQSFTATYRGDTLNAASTSTPAAVRNIKKASPTLTTTVTSNTSGGYVFTVTLGKYLDGVAPTGTVTVTPLPGSGVALTPTTITLVNGVGTATVTGVKLNESIVLSVEYSGDTNYVAVSETRTIVVGKAIPAIHLSATVGSNGRGLTFEVAVQGVTNGKIPTGKVVLKDEKDKTIRTLTLDKDGKATYKWSGAPKGSYQITATYEGDDYYQSVSTYVRVTVEKGPASSGGGSGTGTGTSDASKSVRLLDNSGTVLDVFDTTKLEISSAGVMDIRANRDRTYYTFEFPFARLSELATQYRDGYFNVVTPAYTMQVPYAQLGNIPGFADFLSQNRLNASALSLRVTTELIQSDAISSGYTSENAGSALVSGMWRVTLSVHDGNGTKLSFTLANLTRPVVFAPSASGQATGGMRYDESGRSYSSMSLSGSGVEIKQDGIYALTGAGNG